MDSILLWTWLVRNTTLVQDGCWYHTKYTLKTSKSKPNIANSDTSIKFSPYGQFFILINLRYSAKLSLISLAENPRWPPTSYKIETYNFKIKTICHRSTKFSPLGQFFIENNLEYGFNLNLDLVGQKYHFSPKWLPISYKIYTENFKIQTKYYKSTKFSPFGQLFMLINLSQGA